MLRVVAAVAVIVVAVFTMCAKMAVDAVGHVVAVVTVRHELGIEVVTRHVSRKMQRAQLAKAHSEATGIEESMATSQLYEAPSAFLKLTDRQQTLSKPIAISVILIHYQGASPRNGAQKLQ